MLDLFIDLLSEKDYCWSCSLSRHDSCKRKTTKKKYDCSCPWCWPVG